MRLQVLTEWLDAHEGWGYELDERGIIIANARFETVTHATFAAVEANTLTTLTGCCPQGKDVDHITRVTGYFSRTSGWNKGKAGELKDRYRPPTLSPPQFVRLRPPARRLPRYPKQGERVEPE